MKISFINAFYFSDSENIALGLETLADIINNNSKHTAEVIDFNILREMKFQNGDIYKDKDYSYIINKIINSNAKVVSFYTMSCSIHISLIIAEKIKQINPDTTIIFAGPHASLLPVDLLENFKFIDIVAIGEGESYIVNLIDEIEKNEKNYSGNVYYKINNRINNNNSDNYPLIKNLDVLPIVDCYDKNPTKNVNSISIDVGRGCPFGCTYCSTKSFWKRKFRVKSVSRLISEITYFKNKYNVNTFLFVHDLFTANKEYITEFCKTIISENIKIKWSCSSRIDTLSEELLILMKKAGCNSLYLGIETGSQRMQKIINKNLKIDKIYPIISIMKDLGFSITASFIYGFPDEKIDNLKETLLLIEKLKIQFNIKVVQLHLCEIFPGTELFDKYKNKLVLNTELKNYELNAVNVLQHKNLISKYPNIFSSFYSYENEITTTYPKLDLFVSYVYNNFADYMPNTLSLILCDLENTNLILELYKRFNIQMDKFEKIITDTNTLKNSGHFLLEILKLCKSLVEKEGDYVKDLYEFELAKNIVNINKSSEKILKSKYDIFKLLKERKVEKKECVYRLFISDEKLKIQHIRQQAILNM